MSQTRKTKTFSLSGAEQQLIINVALGFASVKTFNYFLRKDGEAPTEDAILLKRAQRLLEERPDDFKGSILEYLLKDAFRVVDLIHKG